MANIQRMEKPYIPFAETKKYVDKIIVSYKMYKYLYGEEENI